LSKIESIGVKVCYYFKYERVISYAADINKINPENVFLGIFNDVQKPKPGLYL